MNREASLSHDERYRYRLSRSWAEGGRVTFVMLNPSTADDQTDDPTLRRCMSYAREWGFAGLNIVNLYALRATNPLDLWKAADPVGPENNHYLKAAGMSGELLVAAWGSHAKPERVREVVALAGFDKLTCLRATKNGSPGHPLYLPRSLTPISWGLADHI